jgi:hypothetical protein
MGLVGVAWLILVVLLLGLILVQAEGAPSVPTVTVSGTLTPSVVQTVQVSFTNTMYATQPVNSVLNFGTAVVYKAIVNNITVVAFNQKIATSAISSSGLLYTMQATASISIPQLCSGALCDGFIENLTVTAYSTASTWVGFWQSSSVTVSFLSSSPVVFNPAPHIAAAPIGAFLYETVGMATIFSAVVLIVIGLSGIKPDYMYVAGGLTVVVFILEVLVFLEGL